LGSLLERNFRIGVIIGVLWLAAYGVHAAQRSADWQDHGSLWGAALERAPLMPRPHLYMADHYKGASQYERALGEYERALKVYPQVLSGGDMLAIYNNMGSTYLAMGRNSAAIAAYRKALQLDPDYSRAREALEGLLALRQEDSNPTAKKLHKQGLMMMSLGQLDEAVQLFEQALKIQLAPEFYMGLGMAQERRRDWVAALAAFETLKLLVPGTNYARTATEKINAIKVRL